MGIGGGSILFGFVAGLLSILSPCVLPVLPLVLGPALASQRFGLLALAGGLVVSFVSIGLFVATVGFSIGLDGDVFRSTSAILLAVMGVVLLSGALQARFAIAAGGVSDAGHRMLARLSPGGARGQFVFGLLLGAVWSPCVGPTLGAASVLASRGESLTAVAAVMMAFGLGAAVPLLLVGMLSREVLMRWRGRLLWLGQGGKVVLGAASIAVSVLILSGFDRSLETALVLLSPAWLTDLTTRF